LKLQYDETLSNFAFNFKLRRYSVAAPKPNTDFWKDMGNIAMGIVWQTAGPDCLLIVYQCTQHRAGHRVADGGA
jgi:hypothetical protein